MSDASVATQAGPENKLALKHGAFSQVSVAERLPKTTAEIYEAMSEAVPFLEPIDSILVEQAARTLTRLRMIDEWLDRLGGSWTDSRGRPRQCWGLYRDLSTQLRGLCSALGIGPVARAQLMGGLAQAQQVANTKAAQDRLREKHGPALTIEPEVDRG